MTRDTVTRSQLAKDLNLTVSAITKILTTVNAPAVTTLIALADYFNTSTDYLLGRSDSDAVPLGAFSAPDDLAAHIGTQLDALMAREDVTQYQLAKDLKRGQQGQQGIAFIRQGVNTPTVDTLVDFADYFKVSTDYLLGRTET